MPDHLPSTPFHLKPGYVSRDVPAYYEDQSSDKIWQPDVYRLLRDLALADECTEIMDIGCGRAAKLTTLAAEFRIVGVDIGSNLDFCRDTYGWGTWIDADLEQPLSLAPPDPAQRRAIVCADVIEHLVDPTGLLTTLSRLLPSAAFALLSTPERDLSRGSETLGPPDNAAHVREWNLRELRGLLTAHGLTVVFAGLTASNDELFEPWTSLMLLVPAVRPRWSSMALAARCQALLRTYAAERRWAAALDPVDGRASEAEDTVGADVLPDLSSPSTQPAVTIGATGSAVSIVLPALSDGELADPVLHGLQSQTWTDWELLVPDAAHRLADRLQATFHEPAARVRTFTAPASSAAAVVNAGVAAARGRYVALLDPAVCWDPLFLAAAVAHLDSHRTGTVRGVAVFAEDETAAARPDGPSLTTVGLALADVRMRALIYARDIVSTVGGYGNGLDTVGDAEFIYRCLLHFDIDVLPLVLMRAHGVPPASGLRPTTAALEQHRQRTRLLNTLMRQDHASSTPDGGAAIAAVVLQYERLLRQHIVEARAREGALAEREAEREATMAWDMGQLRGELAAARTETAQVREQWQAQRRDVYALMFQRLAGQLRRANLASVAIVGCGEFGDVACQVLRRAFIAVVAAGDNAPERWNSAWNGLTIRSVEDTATTPADAIVIASLLHIAQLTHQVREVLRAGGETRRILNVFDSE